MIILKKRKISFRIYILYNILMVMIFLFSLLIFCFSDNGFAKADYYQNKSEKFVKIVKKNNESFYFNINDVASDALKDSSISNHIKEINGHYFYINDDGSIAKSLLINSNGKSYFFGKNGQLADLSGVTPTFQNNKNIINSNDAIYKITSDSITNTDGFITADSWYRPKKILQNGKKWISSTKKDFRPLISIWWPSKQVQVNYINYMNKKGLGKGLFNINSSQDKLDFASQLVKKNIEKKIFSEKGKTFWLHKDINAFIKTQPEWNLNSEGYNLSKNPSDYVDGFQGGTIIYKNSKFTPYSNSDYRLLNRTPSNQTGTSTRPIEYGGYEMLLANDVDNSNPIVQAEDLNWLHYLIHFGSITEKNSKANFDSIRVDAVDNMDADLLNISSQYFNSVYKTNRSEKYANDHLSILEDWSPNDASFVKNINSDQLTLDSQFRTGVNLSLFNSPKQRLNFSILNFFTNRLVDRNNDQSENEAIPNYSMVRAHDSGVQDVIAKIINDHINKKSNGFILNNNEIKKAFKIYDADQKLTNKKYTQYNIPSSYALMLTNKDTVPRVYYGDLFTDDGQFMENKNLYYNPIDLMLKARIKYVSGGQSMNIVNIHGDSPESNVNDDSILTSVRYGKGALSPNNKGNSITRKSGIAVVLSNNPKLKLSTNDKITINMGLAHKNQSYRPLIDSSKNGLKTYTYDGDVNKIIHTDSKGVLTLTSSEISGYSNPQESGYLSMWVPVGAHKNQDVRTQPSNNKNKNGRTLNSNAALDSNLIFEGFSNFQSMPKKKNQYENVVIPKKVNLFKSWGVTYMQLPPQYRSVNDNSFLDSTVRDGYSFNDRYDLGFNKPTKYGTASQLANTIESLHRDGIKVMADFVPDQLYSMPKKQIVFASKSDVFGNQIPGSNIYNSFYSSNTMGNGKDYQAKYGGKFLKNLKKNYPKLFDIKQVSTGKRIDSSTKIKTWSAKYFNGSNLQGKGAYYVLSNNGNSNYFMIKTKKNKAILKNYLPKQLYGKIFKSGLYIKNTNIKYRTTSGYDLKDGFYQDGNGYWYYFDKNGNLINGTHNINSADYYFLPNGINLRNFVENDVNNGKLYYFNKNGAKESKPGYYSTDGINRFYVQSDGSLMTGSKTISFNKVYFYSDGIQAIGKIVNYNGNSYYYEPSTGNLATNKNLNIDGIRYHADNNGVLESIKD